MKRKMFSILAVAAIAFTSCKKDEPMSAELGEANVSGTVWGQLDLTDTDQEGIEGMQVTIIVDTENWDQSPDPSYEYDKKVYTTTVAADGSWSLTIPATEDGYNVEVMFEDYHTTRTTSTGTENVEVSNGTHTAFVYAGAMISYNDEANIDVLDNSSTGATGTATAYGFVWYDNDDANWDGASPGYKKWDNGALNVSWVYYDAPYGGSETTVYTAAVQADGSYSITFSTEAIGDGSVGIEWGIFDFAGSQIQNNNAGTADSTVSGIYTSYGIDYWDDSFNAGDMITGYDIYLDFTSF